MLAPRSGDYLAETDFRRQSKRLWAETDFRRQSKAYDFVVKMLYQELEHKVQMFIIQE